MYPHQKLIVDNKINVSSLDSETQEALKDFQQSLRGIKLIQGRGKNTANAEAKLARLDRWICGDILDYIDSLKGIDSDRNNGVEAEDIVEELEDAIEKQQVQVKNQEPQQQQQQQQQPEEPKKSGWGLNFLNW